MPISVPQMAANTKNVTFTADEVGNTVTLVYHPACITEKTMSAMLAFSQMGEGTAPADIEATFSDFNSLLVKLIVSWDVFEDVAQTQMFPLDAKRLAELPFSFRMAALTAMMQDLRPEAGAA